MEKAPMILPPTPRQIHNSFGIRQSMKKIFFTSLLLLIFAILKCDDEPRDPITLRIFSYYQSFTGSYTVDDSPAVAFTSASSFDTGTGATIYYSEYEIGEIDSLSVSITTSNTADFLAIRVFKDGVKAKEAVSSSVSSLSLTYEYDE